MESEEQIGLQPLSGYDSDDDGDTLPLLPSSLPLPVKPTLKRSPVRIALLVALALAVTASVFWKSTAPPEEPWDLVAASPSYPIPSLDDEQGFPPSAVSQWLASHSNTEGTIPFSPAAFPALLPLRALEATLSTKGFSTECLDGWIADGQLCPALKGHWKGGRAPRVDVAWTWVNGSEAELLSTWRGEVSAQVGRKRMVKRALGAAVKKHFRFVRLVVRGRVSSAQELTADLAQ